MGSFWSAQAEQKSYSPDLRWTISALIALDRVGEQFMARNGERDKRVECLRNIKTSALFLRGQLEEIRYAGAETKLKDLIIGLANLLSSIFNIKHLFQATEDVTCWPHPRHIEINNMATGDRPWEQDLISRLDQSFLNSLDTWYELQLAMDKLTDECTLEKMVVIDEIEAVTVPDKLEPPDEATCHFFDRVFDAAHCSCGESSRRDLRLRLGTYRRYGQKPNPTSLCVLLRRELDSDTTLQWHELDITTEKENGQPVAEDKCVCRYLKKHTSTDCQLNLVLLQDSLIPAQHLSFPSYNVFQSENLQRQFDLASLISLKEKQWDMDTKWALSILLSYTLLYLHGGTQVHEKWKRENIFFFQDGSKIPLRPFLGNVTTTTIEPGDFHKHPHILLLGVMLLEVFLGQNLESFLELKEPIKNMDELWRKACRAFEKPEFFYFPPLFRQAIRACLAPATFINLKGDNLDQSIRQELFRRIVSPLEIAAFRHFTLLDKNNPDEAAAKAFDLARGVAPKTLSSLSSSLPSFRVTKAEHIDHIPAIPGSSRRKSVTPSEQLPRTRRVKSLGRQLHYPNATSMASDMKPGNLSAIESWVKWSTDFETFRKETFPLLNRFTSLPRVTIIDTGIDPSHPLVQEAGWSSQTSKGGNFLFRDFSGRESPEATDEDGHGTFVAGVLLQLTPIVELSVARIGVTRDSIREDDEIEDKIVEAIEHALCHWNTDIISMSFSQITLSAKLKDSIGDAIRQNVVVLAAAGNHGISRPISYPAKYKNVLKILAANTDGGMESFSAVPEVGLLEDCFAAPGHEIVSSWPSHLLEEAKEDGLDVFCWDSSRNEARSNCPQSHPGTPCDFRTVMSGTSFSTPIVAALVSLLYHFFDATKRFKDAVKLREGFENSFKTPGGVRALLLAMSRTSYLQPYNFISPQSGRNNQMRFEEDETRSQEEGYAVNIFGENRQAFFSRRMSEILFYADL